MSQTIVDYSQSPSGAELLDDMLAKEQENTLTCNSGLVRPSYAVQGTLWLDVSATPWVLKMYDGSDDIIIGTVNATNNEFISSNPLINIGDLLIYGTSNKPTRLAVSSVIDTVLTSNGNNTLPSYKKPPIGVYEYSSSKTYSINEVVIAYVGTDLILYRSKNNNNTNNALNNTTYWDACKVTGKQDVSNLVTSVSSASTHSQYPSAKLFYDTCGDIETLINAL